MSFIHVPQHRASLTYKGVLWMILWALTFNTSMSLTKVLKGEIHTFVIVFIRLCFGFFFISPLLFREGKKILKSQRWSLHFLRAGCTCVSMVCTYYAYTHLPLTVATSIGFSEPIMVSLLSVIFLGDRLTLFQWFLIILGYLGVLVVLRPTEGLWDLAIVMALGANLFASFSLIMVKTLLRTETSSQVLIYFHGFGIVMMAGLSFVFWQPLAIQDGIILGMIGLSSSISQICIVNAMQNGDPSVLSPFEYTRLVLAIPVGVIFFDEVPSLMGILGSVMIIASTFLMASYSSRKKKILLNPRQTDNLEDKD